MGCSASRKKIPSLTTETFTSSHVGDSTEYLRVRLIKAAIYVKQGLGKVLMVFAVAHGSADSTSLVIVKY